MIYKMALCMPAMCSHNSCFRNTQRIQSHTRHGDVILLAFDRGNSTSSSDQCRCLTASVAGMVPVDMRQIRASERESVDSPDTCYLVQLVI